MAQNKINTVKLLLIITLSRGLKQMADKSDL